MLFTGMRATSSFSGLRLLGYDVQSAERRRPLGCVWAVHAKRDWARLCHRRGGSCAVNASEMEASKCLLALLAVQDEETTDEGAVRTA